ncbi:hypothetical protein LCGC14_0922940 [marine sediment metagenome]|uniref:Uncharacterized protein n=1 Tax=marine sediment metagenome TaxID=412755 RepID=A0A0F9R8W9_9ZZZZ
MTTGRPELVSLTESRGGSNENQREDINWGLCCGATGCYCLYLCYAIYSDVSCAFIEEDRMKRILLLLVLAGMLISAGCNCSREWQVYSEEDFKNGIADKLAREDWMIWSNEGGMYNK